MTGGAEKRIHEIGKRLAADGHDVTVYGRHFWDGPEITDHEGMTLHAIAPESDLYTDDGRRSIPEAIDFAARLAPKLRRRTDEHDIVVASVFPYFPVLSAELATAATDTPLVTTWHEVWQDYWNDYLGRLAPFGKAVEHVTARVPQNPIAVSGVTADRLARIGPDRDAISVVPNGIDVERVRTATPATDGFDVLYAGRLIEDKHVDRLIAAFDRLAEERDATLGIIGDGPQRSALEHQVSQSTHTDQISMPGFLDDYSDVLGHMRAADVFVSPSTREGFGITYVEAMAAGCTVVGAYHPDSAAREVIGDAGFLVEPTTDALAATLDDILGGERPRSDPLERAANYDWENIADQAESVYQRAIESKG